MKIFISLPMNGRTDEEILAEIDRIYEDYGYLTINISELINPYIEKDLDNKEYTNIPLAYLAKSIDMISRADMVIFAKGWEKARGCRIEHQCAVDYEIPFIEED